MQTETPVETPDDMQAQWKLRQQFRDKLAEALGETAPRVRVTLLRIATELSGPTIIELLQTTLEIERHGGMLTLDGSRRRTRGGVFFYLARGRMTKEQRERVFPQWIGDDVRGAHR